MATSTGSSPESSCSRPMTTEVSMSPRPGRVVFSNKRACLLRGHPVEVLPKLVNSTAGAWRNKATAVSERTKRCRRSETSSPQGCRCGSR